MGIVSSLAGIPTRLYEYAGIVVVLTLGWLWFIHNHDVALKNDWTADMNAQQVKVEAKLDQLAAPQNKAIVAQYNSLDEALRKYENTPIVGVPDCVAPADLVRSVNALHKARPK